MPTIFDANKTIHDRWFDTGVGWPSKFPIDLPVNGQTLTVATAYPTALKNEVFDTEADWVRFSVLEDDRRQRTMGRQPKARVMGRAVIQLFVQQDRGGRAGLMLAKAARDVFENQKLGTITFFAANVRELGNEGRWFNLIISCPFAYDERMPAPV